MITMISVQILLVALGDLGLTCSPRNLKFVGSDPAEVIYFFSGLKRHDVVSSERKFKLWVPFLKIFRFVKEPQA